MTDYQVAKSLVSAYYDELDASKDTDLARVIARYVTQDYRFRGVHPFNEILGAAAVAATVWEPLRRALAPLQRRQDVFIAGTNELDEQTWVCSMGHLMGLMDGSWLGMPATGKMAFLRYAEFHRVSGDRIAETAFFCDIISVMKQVGLTPLPVQTGAEIIVPGPRTHDGLLFAPQDPQESARTLALINEMRDHLRRYRDASEPLEVLARTWCDGMLWFGPSGIGSTYTIPRYHEQHQSPFRATLDIVERPGHLCRFAEGRYAGWFGWPNLIIASKGGFLGLPSTNKLLEMRVVDVYRREGDKLAENWIFIDLLHWLAQQDLDVLERTCRVARSLVC